MAKKIQKADPADRRKALIVVGIAGGLCALPLVAALFGALDLRARLDAAAAQFVASPPAGVAAMSVAVVPLVLFALYLVVFGARVIRAGRFPLPGQRVVRDTRIREGRAATVHGRVLQVLGILLGLAALSLPVIFARMLALLT